MKPIWVVSVGPGHEAGLTMEARNALDTADVIFAAKRHAEELCTSFPQKIQPLIPLGEAMTQMQAIKQRGLQVAVLVSGDAGLYSLLPMLSRTFGKEQLYVIPGVSSLQAFMAAQGLTWQEARILSAHGRKLSESALCHEVRTHEQTLLLLDAEHDPHWVKRTLDQGRVAARVIIGERIGYSDMHIGPLEDRAYDVLSVALIQNDHPVQGLPPMGLPDEAFIRGEAPMTKREIRMQVLGALQLTPDAIVWDVGAGTGSVSVECARQCPWGHVFAVEKKEDALQLIERNREKFGIANLTLIPGTAPEALEGLPTPTHVFLGGIGASAETVIQQLCASGQAMCIVATAVTVESQWGLTQAMKHLPEFSAVQLYVSRVERVGRYTMMRAQNPVSIFSARINGEEKQP